MWGEQRSNLGLNLGSAFYYPCDFEQVSDSVSNGHPSNGCDSHLVVGMRMEACMQSS